MEAAVMEVGMIRGKETRLKQGLTTLSLLLFGATTRTSPSQIKGHLEPEQIARELDEIKLNHSNTSHENSHISTENTNSKRTDVGEPQGAPDQG